VAVSKSDLESLTFAQNAIYVKVFSSFDKKTLNFCQFYSGYLTLKYIRLSKLFRFLTNLQSNSLSPANILFHWFGKNDLNNLCTSYKFITLLLTCLMFSLKQYSGNVSNVTWKHRKL